MNKVREAALAWQANAIEKCRSLPECQSGELCAECMCSHPCLCDDRVVRREMRAYYDLHKGGDVIRAATVNWGEGDPVTEMLSTLQSIANLGAKAAAKPGGIAHNWTEPNWRKEEPGLTKSFASLPFKRRIRFFLRKFD